MEGEGLLVAGSTLTREEAARRAQLIAAPAPQTATAESRPAVRTSVRLDLTTLLTQERFHSTTVLRFACTEPGATTFVDLVGDVRRARLNGIDLDLARARSDERILLTDLQADNTLEIEALCHAMNTGEGLHRFVDPVDERVYIYTQFETHDARRVFACFDQPDIKTTFELEAIAPQDWLVVSTTPADVTGEPVSDGADADAATRWHFPPSRPLSTYVTAVVAGPYHHVDDRHEGHDATIPLGLYCRRSLAEHLDAGEIFTVTKQGFEFFERTFGRAYPFEKYDQLFVPEFNAGAMENAGCVTFVEDYLFRSRVTDTAYEHRAGTILHEMAHMWFGDLVTMRWWNDLWLNESFATYMANLAQAEATRWNTAWTTFTNEEKTWAYRQDQLSTTHPIATEIPDVEAVETNFDGITYAKGAAVLKQLVAWVGREPFFAGLHQYFDEHAWGNTSLQDLLRALEVASQRDLSGWSKEWLETAGVNTLRPQIETDDDGLITSFAVLQEAPAEHPTLRSHRLAIGCYDEIGTGLTRVERVELDVVGARTDVPQLVGKRRPALVVLNDDDLTYAKIRLDEQSLESVAANIGSLAEAMPRALSWAAAWDMTRDAEMATRDYLRMVIHLLDAERDVGVLQSVLRQARLALERWADPRYAPIGLDLLASSTYARLENAEPGSDYQLAFVRSFAASAKTPRHLDIVASLLSGDTALPGLAVDTELRWLLLSRLAAHGHVNEAAVDAEVARDDTAAGHRHAAATRASFPAQTAKDDAWQRVFNGSDAHNAEISAIVDGFQQSNQVELLEPFVQRYFDDVAEMWARRTGDTARTIAEGLFPYLVISEATIEATDRFLRDADPHPNLRRIVLEGRDGLARALRARARDAAADEHASYIEP